MSSSKPEKTIKVGGVQLSIWANDTGKGVFHSVTIDKSYKDGDTWKRTKSFKPTDLMKVQLGITEVLKYLYVKDVIVPKTDEPQF
ncbi:hypothetical protein LCGC14_0404150 [marine sediment metagenome]|uniref:Uncharacterized protein n=1 Tax=marine sediment metagenome TaxID=412755 RepID=A0A0F9VHW3_9ZZZZ